MILPPKSDAIMKNPTDDQILKQNKTAIVYSIKWLDMVESATVTQRLV